MLFNLLGTVAIGVGAAGVVLIALRLLRRPAPKWLAPAVAGVSMLGYQIWSGYTWYQRTADALPDKVHMVKTYAHSSVLTPWTLIFPQVDRFVAVDLATVRRNEKAPNFALATIYLVTRYQPAASGMQIFDCVAARRADLGPTTEFEENGLPKNAAWSAVDANDDLLSAVCATK